MHQYEVIQWISIHRFFRYVCVVHQARPPHKVDSKTGCLLNLSCTNTNHPIYSTVPQQISRIRDVNFTFADGWSKSFHSGLQYGLLVEYEMIPITSYSSSSFLVFRLPHDLPYIGLQYSRLHY